MKLSYKLITVDSQKIPKYVDINNIYKWYMNQSVEDFFLIFNEIKMKIKYKNL